MRTSRLAAFACAVALLCAAVPGAAQERALARSPVVTLNQERLLTQSMFGKRLRRELEAAAAALTSENSRIEAELVAEEQDLTDRRPTMEHDAFRELADAFDAKVVDIRQRQDDKGRAIEARGQAERARFFEAAGPILLAIVQESGALVLLEKRMVLLAAESLNITDIAIARVDAELGDGASAPPDGSAPGEALPEAPAAPDEGSTPAPE